MGVAVLTSAPLPATAMRAAFMEWFGVRRMDALVLVELFRAKDYLSAQSIACSLNSTCPSVEYSIGQLRQALDVEAIDQMRNRGYKLTEAGRAECQAVLWTIAEELRRVR